MSDREPLLHVGRGFRVTDRAQALDWLASYNLGSLISTGPDGWPRASSSPLIIHPDADGRPHLYAHLDRRNPQVEHLRDRRPLLYVAHGPRAYVSPGWFPRRPAAPTYLHITVHVRGRPELLDEEQTAWLLLETVATFERRLPQAWQYDSGERFLKGSASGGVTGFELIVDQIEAACKLSQDRSTEERMLIAAQLEQSARSDDRAIRRDATRRYRRRRSLAMTLTWLGHVRGRRSSRLATSRITAPVEVPDGCRAPVVRELGGGFVPRADRGSGCWWIDSCVSESDSPTQVPFVSNLRQPEEFARLEVLALASQPGANGS